MPNLKYGQKVYIKNEGDAADRRWLCGCRGTGNKGVRTDDKGKEPDHKIDNYQWEVWRRWNDPGSGNVNRGEYVFLKCTSTKDRWFTGGRGRGNKGVRTDDGEGRFGTDYEWMISNTRDSRPDRRVPIKLGETVYLHVDVVIDDPELLLTGGRGRGNKEVRTEKDIDKGSYFEWMLEAV